MTTSIVYRAAAAHEAGAIAGFQVAMALETETIALDPPVVRAASPRSSRGPSWGVIS
ncbi:MAG: hypothetical protein QM811_25465 [Pirellulales bacterium]